MACDRRTLLAGAMALALAAGSAGDAFAQDAKIPIAVIGGGNIGGTIGGLWVKAGHPVMFASRHPEDLKPLVEKLGPLAKAYRHPDLQGTSRRHPAPPIASR